MAKRIAIANQKGGVGKTTTTITLGYALAAAGKRVLLVDLDPQASLTLHAGVEILDLQKTIVQCLQYAIRGQNVADIARDTCLSIGAEGLDLLPTNLDLSSMEVQLFSAFSREQILDRVLKTLDSAYDVILIDCPPALGLFTINALTAADYLIVPVATDFLSFRGAQLLLDQTLPMVQQQLNNRLKLLSVLPTLHDDRTVHARAVLGELKNLYGDVVVEPVKNTVRFKEAANAGVSVLPLLEKEVARPYDILVQRILHG